MLRRTQAESQINVSVAQLMQRITHCYSKMWRRGINVIPTVRVGNSSGRGLRQRPPALAGASPLGSPVQDLPGDLFQVDAAVLMGAASGNRRDPLHEVENALCGATDYAEQARRVTY